MTLLEKCNADVFKAIIDIKAENPTIAENMFFILQKHEYWWQLTGQEILSFALPLSDIWDRKIYTFYYLFLSQETTTMP